MQFQYLPTEERFYVRFTEEGTESFPGGAFSTAANYPVYAIRIRETDAEPLTEFFIPGSDGSWWWVDMRHTRAARRA